MQDELDEIVMKQENKERKNELKNERRRMKIKRNEAGEWYPGIHKHTPIYDVSRPPRAATLMSAGWITLITVEGQEFKDGAAEFRWELAKYASAHGFKYTHIKNDSRYIHFVCKLASEEGCEWFIKGGVNNITRSFFIKQAKLVHTCRLSLMRNDTSRRGAQFIASIVQERVRSNPNIKPVNLKTDLLNTHGFELSYMKVWRAVEVARGNIFGSYNESFDELRWYSKAIKQKNPGTNKFQRFFFAFNASIEGFKHCRSLLFIDGAFMNNRYKGTILAATAKDGNNGTFL